MKMAGYCEPPSSHPNADRRSELETPASLFPHSCALVSIRGFPLRESGLKLAAQLRRQEVQGQITQLRIWQFEIEALHQHEQPVQ
jgi:hypothetical protein